MYLFLCVSNMVLVTGVTRFPVSTYPAQLSSPLYPNPRPPPANETELPYLSVLSFLQLVPTDTCIVGFMSQLENELTNEVTSVIMVPIKQNLVHVTKG